MHSTLVITLLNTAFWFVLHFGIAELLTHLPAETQRRLFDWNRPFFRVSERGDFRGHEQAQRHAAPKP